MSVEKEMLDNRAWHENCEKEKQRIAQIAMNAIEQVRQQIAARRERTPSLPTQAVVQENSKEGQDRRWK